MSKGKVLRYSLGIKSRGGGYSSVVKDMTESQFEKYYDKVVENGGKVIGVFTDEIK